MLDLHMLSVSCRLTGWVYSFTQCHLRCRLTGWVYSFTQCHLRCRLTGWVNSFTQCHYTANNNIRIDRLE